MLTHASAGLGWMPIEMTQTSPITPREPGGLHQPGLWQRFGRHWGMLILSIAMAVVTTRLLLNSPEVTREAAFMGGIFILAAALWVTEALPLFATSLLVIGLQVLLLANPGGWPGLGFENGQSPSFKQIISVTADPVLFLFFGGFILAHAATKMGVDRAMSVLLLRPFGDHPRWMLLGLMLVTLAFGTWMSNTATAAMMLAMITPMLAALPPKEPFRKAVVLSIALTANIGGIGTPISSPPNAVAMSFLQKEGYHIPFIKWMLAAVPLSIALTILAWLVLWMFFPPVTKGLRMTYVSEKLTPRGWFVVVVFLLTVVMWMTDMLHGLPAAAVALLPVILLTTTGTFTRQDLTQIDWSILILIAGGIALGSGMQMTGLDQLIVQWLPTGGKGIWLLIALVMGTIFVGTFMSNTAAANLFLPIGISSAMISTTAASEGGGLHPIQAAISIALAASMSMALPISTPPNAMAYSRGEFATGDMVRVTLTVSSVAIALVVFGGGFVLRLWGIIP